VTMAAQLVLRAAHPVVTHEGGKGGKACGAGDKASFEGGKPGG